MALSSYQIYLIVTLAAAAILYFVRYRKMKDGIFRLIGLVGKLSLAFFVIVDMLLPQFGINVQIYPDPISLIIMLVVIFLGDYFNADKGKSPKVGKNSKTNKQRKRQSKSKKK